MFDLKTCGRYVVADEASVYDDTACEVVVRRHGTVSVSL